MIKFENKIESKKDEILRWFENNYTPKDNFPFFQIDGKSGEGNSDKNSLAELGDYLPFLLYFGLNSYAQKQLEIAEDFFDNGFIIMENNPSKNIIKKAVFGDYTWSFEYTDFILGLLECYELTKNKETLQFAEKMMHKVFYLFGKNGMICNRYYPRLNYRMPISDSLSGMYIELLVDLFKLTNKKEYLEKSNFLAKNWIQVDFFQSYGLFPELFYLKKYYTILRKNEYTLKPTQNAYLTKYNSTMVAGILSLYEVTKDPILKQSLIKWNEGIQSFFQDKDGGLYDHVEIVDSKVVDKGAISITNFAIVDLLCDIYYVTKDDLFLNNALIIASFWEKQISKETGLLPAAVSKSYSSFDGETDFVIAFMKLYELTNQEKYRDAAKSIFNGQLKFHHCEKGYVDKVNIFSGEIVDHNIQTRFVSLFLKAIMVMSSGKKIYDPNDKTFLSLLRDR